MVRCKMMLHSAKTYAGQDSTELEFVTQYDQSIPEDQRFTKATPSGKLTVLVDNPSAEQELAVGAFYYLDLTKIG